MQHIEKALEFYNNGMTKQAAEIMAVDIYSRLPLHQVKRIPCISTEIERLLTTHKRIDRIFIATTISRIIEKTRTKSVGVPEPE